MQSEIIKKVISDIQQRELKGIETYNVTMDRKDLTREMWMRHAYEEALDFAIYLRKLMELDNDKVY